MSIRSVNEGEEQRAKERLLREFVRLLDDEMDIIMLCIFFVQLKFRDLLNVTGNVAYIYLKALYMPTCDRCVYVWFFKHFFFVDLTSLVSCCCFCWFCFLFFFLSFRLVISAHFIVWHLLENICSFTFLVLYSYFLL